MTTTLLPYNATDQEKVIELATGSRVDSMPVDTGKLWNPETCPAELLPWLSWALSVDDWRSEWTERQKRDVLKASFLVHRSKGTRGAMARQLANLGYDLQVVEWWQDNPVADPYTFKVEITATQSGIGVGYDDVIESLIRNTKNARSHLSTIETQLETRADTYQAAAVYSGDVVTINPQA